LWKAFCCSPPVDIDGICEPVSGSLLYGNNIRKESIHVFIDLHENMDG
jgi:hypothetical protein